MKFINLESIKIKIKGIQLTNLKGMKNKMAGKMKEFQFSHIKKILKNWSMRNTLMLVAGVGMLGALCMLFILIFPASPSNPDTQSVKTNMLGHVTWHAVEKPADHSLKTKSVSKVVIPHKTVAEEMIEMQNSIKVLQQVVQSKSLKDDKFQKNIEKQVQNLPKLQSDIEQMAAQQKLAQQQLGQLSEAMSSIIKNTQLSAHVQTSIENIQTTLNAMKKTFSLASSQMQLLYAQQNQIKDKLSLTAVVDQHAWLEDQEGKSYSVQMGTDIPGYGKVVKIDDKKNMVYTNSGYVFK